MGLVLATSTNIRIGNQNHITTKVLGMTVNLDTIYSTLIAGAIVLGMGFWLRRRVTAGVPGRIQLFWETVLGTVQDQVDTYIGPAGARAVPLAVTLFMFILFANLLELIPTGTQPSHLIAPTGDVNLTYALGLFVIVVVIAAAIRTRGLRGYLGGFTKPYKALAPINVIEELTKPLTLALRLFGNIFSGALMLVLISALFTPYIAWAPNVVWKLFDIFIALIQAFIFALLTVIYFQFATEGH